MSGSLLVRLPALPLREGAEVTIGRLMDGARFTRDAVLEPEEKEVVVPWEFAG